MLPSSQELFWWKRVKMWDLINRFFWYFVMNCSRCVGNIRIDNPTAFPLKSWLVLTRPYEERPHLFTYVQTGSKPPVIWRRLDNGLTDRHKAPDVDDKKRSKIARPRTHWDGDGERNVAHAVRDQSWQVANCPQKCRRFGKQILRLGNRWDGLGLMRCESLDWKCSCANQIGYEIIEITWAGVCSSIVFISNYISGASTWKHDEIKMELDTEAVFSKQSS